jgi:hypothetical protein
MKRREETEKVAGQLALDLQFGIELRVMVVNRSYKRGTSMYAMQRKIFFRRLP